MKPFRILLLAIPRLAEEILTAALRPHAFVEIAGPSALDDVPMVHFSDFDLIILPNDLPTSHATALAQLVGERTRTRFLSLSGSESGATLVTLHFKATRLDELTHESLIARAHDVGATGDPHPAMDERT